MTASSWILLVWLGSTNPSIQPVAEYSTQDGCRVAGIQWTVDIPVSFYRGFSCIPVYN